MSINVNDKNLGHATAYAYYKAGGGTMTEAKFTEFMADFGTASQTAVEAAQAALASETAARTAATTATNKASEATTAATTATTKAQEAVANAEAAARDASQAMAAESTATAKATEATTAAETAVSAKDDAVAANTAAQSAKTAAQTAQTGAETAAASVEASAAQITKNATDINELKSGLSAVTGSVNGYTGLQCVLFDATKAHSSTIDKIKVSVKAGERYFSKIIIDNGESLTGQFLENGTITGYAYTNIEQSHIATVDDPYASFYIPKSESGDRGYFIVYTDEYTKLDLFDTALGKINNFRYTYFMMTTGGHSAGADKLVIPVKQGQTYYTYIRIESGENTPFNSGNFRENGTVTGYANTNIVESRIATVDVPEIGFYIPALTNPSNCLWCAYTVGDSSPNDINIMYTDRKRYVAQLENKPLFLVYADIHGSGTQLGKIKKFHEETIPNKVFDSILLGDMVQDKFGDDFTYITNSEFGSKTLKVIGNHDVWDNSGIGSLGTLSVVDVYNKFFKPNIASWGVTQPDNAESQGKCYYYKDYPKVYGGSAMAIRLITINEFYWDETQATWLGDTLNDALSKDLSVFVCMHQSVCTEAEAHGLDARNSFRTRVSGAELYPWDAGYRGSYAKAFITRRKLIDAFKANGGKFICYLAGHSHADLCCYFDETNGKQTQLTLNTAFPWGSTSNNRISPYASDCFTYFGVDVDLGYLYLVRVGVAEDRNLHATTVLTYDYINNTVIDVVI